MTAAVLEMRSVDKSYRRGPEEIHALRLASLTLDAGEMVALVGPSGSGKTTLLNVIAGWEGADEGSILWHGETLEKGGVDLGWSDLAILPQSLGLIEELSIRENIDLPLKLGRATAPASGPTGLLTSLGLETLATRYPQEVSLGEQQRAALARCLAQRPSLMLADEPTGHQDVGWARRVLDAIRTATSEGTACLMVTHHAAAAGFADRVLAIKDGAIAPADHLDTDLLGDDL